MTVLWGILIFLVGGIIGAVAGFYGARQYMKKYFQENPPINEDVLRSMMAQMGQKPSAKKLNQMMNSMKAEQKKANSKK
ncbi:hypothetical protein IV38_GL000506 [Lactobacillus selangorensis]|uniref:UPF0154 protein IV38_GL000506 n=1 Tax=Lactobacillus selangorensis TaxID=81857 RepID=A0A0R2FM15_9LACO|nr:YneF family protein [Lactobacillus selangorensis]KRN29619.1 hypothetical protein IV38_GL000506 [Lactobacillus selangorensis]KRN33851.1 hypothetical protein IV40_GL000162 [Lactobacillus selangorensis]